MIQKKGLGILVGLLAMYIIYTESCNKPKEVVQVFSYEDIAKDLKTTIKKLKLFEMKIDSLKAISVKETIIKETKTKVIDQDFSGIEQAITDNYKSMIAHYKSLGMDSTGINKIQAYYETLIAKVRMEQNSIIDNLKDSLQYIKDNPETLFDKKQHIADYIKDGFGVYVTTDYFGKITNQKIDGSFVIAAETKSSKQIGLYSRGASDFNGSFNWSAGIYFSNDIGGLGIGKNLLNQEYELYLSKSIKTW